MVRSTQKRDCHRPKSVEAHHLDNVIERFDNRNLNLDCPEFEGINPTTENIAKVIWEILRENLDPKFGIEVQLSETEKNKALYNGNWFHIYPIDNHRFRIFAKKSLNE